MFEDGGYWCRQCQIKGWLDNHATIQLSPQQLNEIRLRRLERQMLEHDRRLSALERMHKCTDHVQYHKLMDDDDWEYWHQQGMFDDTIKKYLLGICYNCPTDREHRASYTIPVINDKKLVNIRHRIADATDGDKYRPHMAGLGNTLFNADFVYDSDPKQIIVCEGEKKSIVLDQWGFDAVGVMGKGGFPDRWAMKFERFGLVYVCLDPDAREEAFRIADLFGERGRVVVMAHKADDFFTLYGGRPPDFRRQLQWARKV